MLSRILGRPGANLASPCAVTGEAWDRPITTEDVRRACPILLGRDLDDVAYAEQLAAQGMTLGELVASLAVSDEHRALLLRRHGAPHATGSIPDRVFRVPDDLARKAVVLKRVLLIGSCITDLWSDVLTSGRDAREVERILFNNAAELAPLEFDAAHAFDAQIVSLPLRSVWPEALTYSLRVDDAPGWRTAQEHAFAALASNLEAALRHHREHGLETYVLGFLVPQQNSLSRTLRTRTLANPVAFVRQLNWRLQDLIRPLGGCHFIDIDEIAASLGKRYVMDDALLHTNHHAILYGIAGDAEHERLEPPGDVEALYGPKAAEFVGAVMQEVEGLHRAVRQIDAVKLVVFDLDDTLWRGVVGEVASVGSEMAEGWPLGMVEVLAYLHRRGIMLALCSKNDEAVARAAWDALYGRLFPFDRFVVTRIGWSSKAEAVAEVLAAVNILPDHALFVDDNPVERAAVEQAFPAMRTLGPPLATWRRRLLWAPELQVVTLTPEARDRTAMVQAQVRREDVRKTGDRDAFLKTLNVSVVFAVLCDASNLLFERALELLNKTNQFNTTGRRWTHGELTALFAEGGRLLAATVQDRFSAYGLVSVIVLKDAMIEQMVLSCRVFGLDVERAMTAEALAMIGRAGHAEAEARLKPTARNGPCLPLLPACGFVQAGEGVWRRDVDPPLAAPAYVAVTAAPATG